MRSRRALRPAALGIALMGLCGCRVQISATPFSTDGTSTPTLHTAERLGLKSSITGQRGTPPTTADPFLETDEARTAALEQPDSTASEVSGHPPAEPAARRASQPELSPGADSPWRQTRSP